LIYQTHIFKHSNKTVDLMNQTSAEKKKRQFATFLEKSVP